VFKKPLRKKPTAYPAYPDPFDRKADLAARVKSYLDVNCAMCHVSNGGGNSLIELGYQTPLAKARLIDEAPIHDSFNIADARLIARGSPERSVLYHRIARRGEGQMPPMSTNRVDTEGARLLADWIRQLAN
jgi:mono/diheme cytochrome c family protein